VTRAKAERDAAVVHQLREAGAIPVLTTTLAEAAIGSVTANPWTGACANPHDPAFNAGGSSGGSAAVVAAGLVPFALGTDTMGSVRIPAACCGIFGWKPSRGLLSNEGLVPLASALDTVGVLSASSALLRDVADLFSDDRPMPLLRRVGILSLNVPLDESAQRAVNAVAQRIADEGVEVIQVHLDLDPALVRRRGLLLCEAEAASFWGSAVDGDPPGLSPALRGLLAFGRDADESAIRSAESVRVDVEAAMTALFDDVDALLLPTLPGPPPLIGDDPPGLADLTAFVNLAGVPALSFPTTTVAPGESIPRSVQLVGENGSDRALIAFVDGHLQ
jgi:aspartyl-tRNA(Asn)/glutamyl-tRNA(Gln) amidotransferase subunit A